MIRIYLIRHAQSLWNIEKRFQGRANIGLSDHGRKQAQVLKDHLAEHQFDAAYSSTLDRAYHTASISLDGHDLDIQKHEGFQEIHGGEFQGKTREENLNVYEELYEKYWDEPDDHNRAPNGESFLEAQQRMVSALESIIGSEPVQNLVVFSHGMSLRLMLCHYNKQPISSMRDDEQRIHNCSVSVLEGQCKDSLEIISLGEVLSEALQPVEH